MKVKKMLFGLVIFFMCFISVNAKNRIYNIDMNIYIDKDGNANITETWEVNGSDGTEWYKGYKNIGDSDISNFSVSMDGKPLTYKTWNINESLEDKKGYYGINYITDGLELCFGKYDYKKHTFILKYDVSNFIFKTSDNDVLYWTLIDKFSDVDFEKFSINVTSYYSFPDTLDVWGYGYKGYAYVKDGKISMSTEENSDMNNKYVVLLAKFPLNTFNTNNSSDNFFTFNDVFKRAEEGTFDYNYNSTSVGDIILMIFTFGIFGFVIFLIIKVIITSGYGYKGNRVIDKKNTPFFRDIPCNKDIYYANTLIKLNNFGYKETNILGAILLKWVREDKIGFNTSKVGIFNKEESVIDLTRNPSFEMEKEKKLFNMMYKASKDGILEKKEFERWVRNNYNSFFNLFSSIESGVERKLRDSGDIYKRISKEECKKKNVLSDKIYNDSKELLGLKLYLNEFSSIDTKEVMEVKLWDEYLMFAYLFGIADKVAKQLKNMYPEVINNNNFDYDTVILVNNLSHSVVNAASSARSAAESYSSGGGGFSSGSGGGGSFGGGGGGGSR